MSPLVPNFPTSSWKGSRVFPAVRDRREQVVLNAERLNELLDSAERARFLEYRTVIARTVTAPLQELRSQWNSLVPEELANRLEHLTSRVWRRALALSAEASEHDANDLRPR